ncbi:hypothetical protein C8Q77DRAFT_671378 [Trametes polyzona]|nr:hypothetical protein C8Q77DRAFT_671378 [Trametes polyzona]
MCHCHEAASAAHAARTSSLSPPLCTSGIVTTYHTTFTSPFARPTYDEPPHQSHPACPLPYTYAPPHYAPINLHTSLRHHASTLPAPHAHPSHSRRPRTRTIHSSRLPTLVRVVGGGVRRVARRGSGLPNGAVRCPVASWTMDDRAGGPLRLPARLLCMFVDVVHLFSLVSCMHVHIHPCRVVSRFSHPAFFWASRFPGHPASSSPQLQKRAMTSCGDAH